MKAKKKANPTRTVLILSLLVLLTLAGLYIAQRIKNRPITVSRREQYQNEINNKEDNK